MGEQQKTSTSWQRTVEHSALPPTVGYRDLLPTLCIGLDIAWYGGSKNNKRSQFDYLVAARLDTAIEGVEVRHERISLIDRDPEAEQVVKKLEQFLENFDSYDRVVFAIDAPLQAAPRRGLQERPPLPKRGEVASRACDLVLSQCRQAIDKAAGGANGWHPRIQPGAPLAPRIKHLVQRLPKKFEIWSPEMSQHSHLAIECFPAEAIWSAKRLGWFDSAIDAAEAKSYKHQKGAELSRRKASQLIRQTLEPFGAAFPPKIWCRVCDKVLAEVLDDSQWRNGSVYSGGKMLDDFVDSMLCLATAMAFAIGNAHAWYDPLNVGDGHMMGPGAFRNDYNKGWARFTGS